MPMLLEKLFDETKPNAVSENGLQYTQSLQSNLTAILDSLLIGSVYGWEVQANYAGADLNYLTYEKGNRKVRVYFYYYQSPAALNGLLQRVRILTHDGAKWLFYAHALYEYTPAGYFLKKTWNRVE